MWFFNNHQTSYLVLTPDIPDCEADVFVFHGLNIKPCQPRFLLLVLKLHICNNLRASKPNQLHEGTTESLKFTRQPKEGEF